MTRTLSRAALVSIIIGTSFVLASSQTTGSARASSTPQATADSQTRTIADETFELNIPERRITEREFSASTTVEVGEETAPGLFLRVGVAVGADEINVLLRNVRGSVRFRATLQRVLELFNARPSPRAVP